MKTHIPNPAGMLQVCQLDRVTWQQRRILRFSCKVLKLFSAFGRPPPAGLVIFQLLALTQTCFLIVSTLGQPPASQMFLPQISHVFIRLRG